MIPEMQVQLSADKKFTFPAINVEQRFIDAVSDLLKERPSALTDSSVPALVHTFENIQVGDRRVFALFSRVSRVASRD